MMEIKIGDKIIAHYHDGREFNGIVTLVENQSGQWGDGNPNCLDDRIMIRIRNEKGNYQSFWLDKCVMFSV